MKEAWVEKTLEVTLLRSEVGIRCLSEGEAPMAPVQSGDVAALVGFVAAVRLVIQALMRSFSRRAPSRQRTVAPSLSDFFPCRLQSHSRQKLRHCSRRTVASCDLWLLIPTHHCLSWFYFGGSASCSSCRSCCLGLARKDCDSKEILERDRSLWEGHA